MCGDIDPAKNPFLMEFQQDKDIYRPPIFDMSDEELAATANINLSTDEVKQPTPNEDKRASQQAQHLNHLLERERLVSDAATRSVVFSPPLISRLETGIIGRGTINIIQGAYGSHKSRLAELLAALMLANDPNDPKFMGFDRTELERFCVCYIDTERNQSEELPFAIQGIKLKAGYTLADQPVDFRFTSIKAIERGHRFDAIEAFLSHVREQTALHLFCLIDVVTDAVGDFNDAKESMRLYDFIGNLCDKHNATFLLVIHQNPGTEKARGHTGTEAANKASTALQIGFEKDASGNDTDLIRLRYLKLRRGKRPEPVYLQYKEVNGLALAEADQVAAHINHRKHKADTEDIADRLLSLLSEGPLPKNEVWTTLETEFKAKNATIRERLKTIVEQQPPMYDEEGRAVRLADYKEGRNQFFKLIPIE
ncbi:AAA domain-containing protein [Spirosoma fluviale]|uniref:AAA domain-containing protein n=2 Tax=Spirosoma fluviale TaxID=1597977 RepID=A0A286GSK9_9BACT|nr:AAA domain-containing protein [Spirosoma fluviale]